MWNKSLSKLYDYYIHRIYNLTTAVVKKKLPERSFPLIQMLLPPNKSIAKQQFVKVQNHNNYQTQKSTFFLVKLFELRSINSNLDPATLFFVLHSDNKSISILNNQETLLKVICPTGFPKSDEISESFYSHCIVQNDFCVLIKKRK